MCHIFLNIITPHLGSGLPLDLFLLVTTVLSTVSLLLILVLVFLFSFVLPTQYCWVFDVLPFLLQCYILLQVLRNYSFFHNFDNVYFFSFSQSYPNSTVL
uniref:Uncharacterized protein n=1 Tax=Cacopsylla melanoneura TaxID=428564 RepID=A0A8D8TC24_9HEMI